MWLAKSIIRHETKITIDLWALQSQITCRMRLNYVTMWRNILLQKTPSPPWPRHQINSWLHQVINIVLQQSWSVKIYIVTTLFFHFGFNWFLSTGQKYCISLEGFFSCILFFITNSSVWLTIPVAKLHFVTFSLPCASFTSWIKRIQNSKISDRFAVWVDEKRNRKIASFEL